jgi:hypothetical protein
LVIIIIIFFFAFVTKDNSFCNNEIVPVRPAKFWQVLQKVFSERTASPGACPDQYLESCLDFPPHASTRSEKTQYFFTSKLLSIKERLKEELFNNA